MVRFLRIGEVAEYLHLSDTSVRAIPEDQLPTARTPTKGGHRRYDPVAVARYMREHGMTVPAKLAADEAKRLADLEQEPPE